MSSDRYEAEQAVVGDLAPLANPSTRARLTAARGRTGADVLAVLEAARSDDPDEPFWKGVRELRAADGHVEVEFNEPIEPQLLPSGDVEVACHLYDEHALRRAEELRQQAGSPVAAD
jgi:peptide/nickel transport system ATP-binding protein